MKQLKLTLHMLELFYYSRKRWPCRLEDALITANVYSTTGNCASSILNKPLGKTTPPLVWSRKTGTHIVLLFVQRSRQSAQIVSAEKLQHQVDRATVKRVRKKAEEHQKEGDWCPWEKPSMPRETLLGFLRPACPRWGLRLHVHSGSQAKLTATGFDSQFASRPSPFLFPGTERGQRSCHCQWGDEGHILPTHGSNSWCCWRKEWRGNSLPTPGISPGSYFCELGDISFLNRQQFEFCFGDFLEWEEWGKEEAEGLFFFLTRGTVMLKAQWHHNAA